MGRRMNASRLWTPLRALVLLGLAACTGAGLDGSAELVVARGAPAHRLDELAMHRWPSRGPPRAVILALHGFGDAGRSDLRRRRRALGAPRHRGLRRPTSAASAATPSRKRWPGAEAAGCGTRSPPLRRCAHRHPGLPLVVVGHSMGGGGGARRRRSRNAGRLAGAGGPGHRRRRRAEPGRSGPAAGCWPGSRPRSAGPARASSTSRPTDNDAAIRPRRRRPAPLRRPVEPRALRPDRS